MYLDFIDFSIIFGVYNFENWKISVFSAKSSHFLSFKQRSIVECFSSVQKSTNNWTHYCALHYIYSTNELNYYCFFWANGCVPSINWIQSIYNDPSFGIFSLSASLSQASSWLMWYWMPPSLSTFFMWAHSGSPGTNTGFVSSTFEKISKLLGQFIIRKNYFNFGSDKTFLDVRYCSVMSTNENFKLLFKALFNFYASSFFSVWNSTINNR